MTPLPEELQLEINSWERIWRDRSFDLPSSSNANLENIKTALRLDGFDKETSGGFSIESYLSFIKKWGGLLDLKSNESVFEVGCGSGAFLASLKHIFSVKAYGSDYSDKLISIGKELFPFIDFSCGDAETTAIPKNINHIFSFSVFQYFDNYNYARNTITNMIQSNARSISILDIPDIDSKSLSEEFRRSSLGDANYDKNYLSKGLIHLYYAKDWMSENFTQDWKISFYNMEIKGYQNSQFRYNLLATRD